MVERGSRKETQPAGGQCCDTEQRHQWRLNLLERHLSLHFYMVWPSMATSKHGKNRVFAAWVARIERFGSSRRVSGDLAGLEAQRRLESLGLGRCGVSGELRRLRAMARLGRLELGHTQARPWGRWGRWGSWGSWGSWGVFFFLSFFLSFILSFFFFWGGVSDVRGGIWEGGLGDAFFCLCFWRGELPASWGFWTGVEVRLCQSVHFPVSEVSGSLEDLPKGLQTLDLSATQVTGELGAIRAWPNAPWPKLWVSLTHNLGL